VIFNSFKVFIKKYNNIISINKIKMKNTNSHIYERMRELSGNLKKDTNNESKISTLINTIKSNDGSTYGIIKENHHYFIKRTSKKENLNESDFAYIGGLENKNNYRFDSVSEAEKQRNFLVKSINESLSLEPLKKTEEKQSLNEGETSSENKVTDVNGFLRGRINEGKRKKSVDMQNKFKSSMNENKEIINKKRGLLPESADFAIKKALGKINEDALTTADSEISDSDNLANKTGKEQPQAPVNDSNAKAKADAGNSQPSDLTTSDSEINTSDAMSNKSDAKESPQAPINDSNAKAEADKATGNEGSLEEPKKETAAIVNESTENQPFDDGAKKESDIATADSDIKTSDAMPEQTDHEKPEAPYNSDNQPDKAHADGNKKGEELKPKESKKDVVAEEKDLTTADSEIADGDVMSNKSDSKEQPQAPINDSNAKAEADKANTGDGSLEEPKKEAKAIVNESDVSEDEETEKNLDDAAAALDDLDIAIDSQEETPGADVTPEEIPAEEPVAEPTPEVPEEPMMDAPIEDEPALDDAPVENGEENTDMSGDEPAPEGGEDDLMGKEIEKLVGKLTQEIRNTDVTPEQTQSILNSVLTSLKSELGDVDIEERKEMSNKIMKATGGGSSEEEATDTEETSVVSDLDKDAEAAIDQKIDDLNNSNSEEPAVEESMCSECGTFEGYINSKGYKDLKECSEAEMASLVSGYANAHNDGENDGDFESVAKYITPNVKTELEEYGHGEYLNKLDPFMKNLSEDDKITFGTIEPAVNDIDIVENDEEINIEEPENSEETPAEEPEVNFAPAAEVLGVSSPATNSTKSVDVDLNSGKVNVTVTESEDKIRKYIRNRLMEKKGLKKSTLNEDKKSPILKKLDEQIDKQFAEMEKNIDEGVFDALKKKDLKN
jgi:hypothetical protein